MQRRLAIVLDGGAVAVAVCLAALAGFVLDASTDFHWHIALGDTMLAERSLYTTDVHSYTFRGAPVFLSSWLSDVALAVAYDADGYLGCFLLRAVALVTAFGLLIRDAVRRGLAPRVSAAIAVFVVGYGFSSFYMRPETLAFALFAGVLASIGAHARTQQRRYLIIPIALCVLWSNVHGSVGIGLFALGLYCAEVVSRQWLFARGSRDRGGPGSGDRALVLWALAAPPLALALSCLNPEGVSLPLAFQVVSDVWVGSIREWRPLHSSMVVPMLQVAALAVVVTTVAAVAVAKKTVWHLVVLVTVLSALSVAFRRFVPFAMFAAVPLVAANLVHLRRLRESGNARLWRVVGPGLAILALSWGLGAVATDPAAGRRIGVGIDPRHASYPVRACGAIRSAGVPGPVFNDYDFGSYLMFCLGRDYPVFIDQRAWSLYSDQHYARFLAADSDPDALASLQREHPATWAIMKYNPLAGQLGAERDRWRVVYFDDKAIVFAAVTPELESFIADHEFVFLNPIMLPRLPQLLPEFHPAASAELARAEENCSSCYRVALARLGLAIATRDRDAVGAAADRLLAHRKDTPEVRYLIGLARAVK